MNKITKNLIFLGTFAFAFSFMSTAYAYVYPVCPMNQVSPDCVVSFNDRYHSAGYTDTYKYPDQTANSTNSSQTFNNNYDNNVTPSNPTVNNANPGTTVGYATPTRTVAVATPKKTTTKTVAVAQTAPVQTQPNTLAQSISANNNGLSANSYSALSWFGAPGFLPNTVFEWILTFFLILILIILTRQFRPVRVHEAHPTAVVHH
jgi:hypothetical protein